MSGQGWEVVGKGNKKPMVPAKKMSKTEKQKFVENAPKIEDVVPLDQLHTLYNAFDNKENSKPPPANNSSKEAAAKKPKKKPEEKKKEPVRVVPKSLTIAASQLDFEELTAVVELNRNRFPDVPLLWLKSLAEYLNARLTHSGISPPLQPKDSLLSQLPSNVRGLLRKTVSEVGPMVLQPFFHHCLAALANEMSKGNTSVTGHKILLQLVATYPAGFKLGDVDPAKVASLRQSYQNKQPIGLSMLWALGQLGIKDASIGLQVWQEFMVPLLEMRNYTTFVVQYLEAIAATQQGTPLSCQQMLSVLDITHSPTLNVPSNLRQNLYNATSALMKRSLQFEPETRSRLFFQLLLERLGAAAKPLKELLLASLIQCLKSDKECFAIWVKIYDKQTTSSALLLDHLRRGEWKNLNVKHLRDTLTSMQLANQVLLQGKQKGDSVQQCQAACEELIGKMTLTRSFPWNFCSFLLLCSLTGLITYDIQRNGSFKSSSTGLFLHDTGVLKHANTAWEGTKHYSSAGYGWAQENVPVYYHSASKTVKPYLGQAKEAAIVVGSHLNQTYWNVYDYTQEKAPLVRGWVNYYAPGLIDGVQTQSIKAWGVTKEYTVMLGSFAARQSNTVCDWAKTNIFVGNLSPEKLHQYSQEAINTTQVYAAWTYDWVREKVHTLSKVQ